MAALTCVFATERSDACSCSEPQAVIADVGDVSRLPVAGPVVIHASGNDATIQLRDESDQAVPLRTIWRSPLPPRLCSDWWWILEPQAALQPGRGYAIELQAFAEDDPSTATELSMAAAETLTEQAATITYRVTWEQTTPELVDAGLCYDAPIAGEMSTGTVTVEVTAEPPVPLFLETELDDAELGVLHDVGSTLVRDGEARSARWQVSSSTTASMLLFESSGECLTVRMRDLSGEPLEAFDWCRGNPPQRTSEHHFTTWRPKAGRGEAGCSVADSRQASSRSAVLSFVLVLLALVRLRGPRAD